MRRKRPGVVTAAAVLCIVFGSLGLLTAIGLLAGRAIQGVAAADQGRDLRQFERQFLERALENYIAREFPWYEPFSLGSAIWLLMESAALLIAGIAILPLQAWARVLAMVFLVFTVVHMIALTVVRFVILSASTGFLQAHALPAGPRGQGPDFVQTVMTITAVVYGIFYLGVIAYLLTTLMLLTKPAAKAAFAAAGSGEVDGSENDRTERERRFEEDRPRRRRQSEDDLPRRPPDGRNDDRFRT
ncbi:MAG: hypothetical protein HY040_02970 [Planctomycetes bacterium]|nr:hypothetical protein [Planctomycetota bacterium]